MKYLSFLLLWLLTLPVMHAQDSTLIEKLGYPSDARLLIIHADDAGMSLATNMAVMAAFEAGRINSSAIMVPCPWFPGIAAYARENPGLDFGIHLTLTSEWMDYKWDGILSKNEIPSLLDETGYFYASTPEASAVIDVREAEKELRAQIDRALASGIRPSHFDTHMSVLFQRPDLLSMFLSLGKEYQVPVSLFTEEISADSAYSRLMEGTPVVDKLIIAQPDLAPDDWADFYSRSLKELEPGLNEFIIHLAYDTEETRAITSGHGYYESSWRQRDMDYIMSDEFGKALKENNIRLITWRDIQQVLYPESRMLQE